MRIKIQTEVKSNWKKVVEGFNVSLFKKLNPPFPPVRVLRFDGCRKGDNVILELNFLFFKQNWEALIIHHEQKNQGYSFVDIAEKLPFFLKSWKHIHGIDAHNSGTLITDDISYTTGFILSDILMYPLLLGQFLYRKPIYKRVFNNGNGH